MERTQTYRRPLVAAVTVLMAAGGLVLAAPANAQEGSQPGGRYRVLVPPKLERQGDIDEGFGEDVSELLRERIDGLATHAPLDEDALDDALDQFDLDEDDLNCITSRQLAVQIGVELIMCGEYQQVAQGMRVSARFIGSDTGEEFEVPAFTAADAAQAASQIFTAFETYINQIRYTTFCLQDLGSQQWQTALGRCNEALALNPNSQSALKGKARALMELDSLEESLTTYQRVLELDPAEQDALLTAGIVATRLEREELAREYFNQYLELNPGNVDVRLSVATDMFNAGDPEGALVIAEVGLEEAPDNVTLKLYSGHFALAAAQQYVSEPQGANGAEQQRPPEADSLFNLALAYYGDVFEQQGSESDPTMLGNMINALLQLGRADEAVELGARVVAAKPDDAGLWSNYASALNRAGRIDLAVAALDSVLARDPEFESVFARRGNWLLQADRLDEAVTAFREAIARGEATADEVGRNIFVVGYNDKYQKDLHDEALEYFALAIEIAESEQTRAMASFWSGYILYQRGIQMQEPSTVESAQASLPVFQRALEFFGQSEAYAETQSSFSLPEIVGATNQYIEIQQLLIERG